MPRTKASNRMKSFTVPKGYHIVNVEMADYKNVRIGITDIKTVKIFFRINEEKEL